MKRGEDVGTIEKKKKEGRRMCERAHSGTEEDLRENYSSVSSA